MVPERDGVNFEVWPEAIELGRMFAEEGYELALVGGPVRDLLLHRKSHDLDFCTSARPEQFEHILRRFGRDGFWDMGRKFGTLGAMRRREDGTEVQVEVTTYRSDTYDPDSRKPEVNYGDTLEGDLSRRDFTVNAMALRVPELEFVDPFGGANDLAKGVLRTPVDPRQSFDDDPLRMMRAVRFVAQLGFRIEPETAEALSDMVDRIEIVSAERVRDELVKLLLSDRPRAGIEALVDSGLADIVLPEIPALQLEIDEHHRHKDVFEHTMIVIERAVALETGPDGPVPAPDLTLRLAALLHDIGKALDHEMEGSHIALGVEFARKYKESEAVVHAIEAHHGDVECKTVVACLVQAADAVSASRPGARRENVENYIKRLQQLEEISCSFEGVERAYAIQAGREVRVMVKPEVVSDSRMPFVAHEIAKKIESEMEYPGQIKVNIIRESRASDVAK